MRTVFAAAFILAIYFFANCSADGGVCAEAGFKANDVNSYNAVKDKILSQLAAKFDIFNRRVRMEFKTNINFRLK
jgi:hypothetical protein